MISSLLNLIRAKHWIKNLIIFAPLIFSGPKIFGDLHNLNLVIKTLLIFCILSSIIYIFNDICDYDLDKLHKYKKKNKPLASGKISLDFAKLSLFFLIIFFFIIIYFNSKLFLVSIIFLFLNFLYSIKLKHIPIVDMFSVAASYIVRVYAGGIAIDISISNWMFITVFSTALFIISLKRKNENDLIGSKARKALNNLNEDIFNYFIIISASTAICFYSLYVILEMNNDLVTSIPLVIFIFFRYLYINNNKTINESPVDLFFSDIVLILSILVWFAVSVMALI